MKHKFWISFILFTLCLFSNLCFAAIEFDGTDDYISFGPDSDFEVQSGEFTVTLWIKTTSDVTTEFDIMANSDVDLKGYFISINRAGGGDGCVPSTTPNIDMAKAGISDQCIQYTWAANTWYHIALVQVFDTGAPHHVNLYVNGVFIGSSSTETTAYNSSSGQTMLIGDHYLAGGWPGQIDDVRVYNRALNTNEIESLGKSRSRLVVTQGRVSYWPFDNGNDGATVSGSGIVKDYSGNGNHGTPNSAPIWRSSNYINYP